MDFSWLRITLSGVISLSPAQLGTVILTPKNESKKTYVTLYDGESAQDPELCTIRCLSGETKVVNFQPYLQTQRGLYCYCGGDLGEVLIQVYRDHE